MDFRTDLALERKELVKGKAVDGIKVKEKQNSECKTTIIDIVSESAAKKIGKGIGRYITLEMNAFSDEAAVSDGRLKALTECIESLIQRFESSA